MRLILQLITHVAGSRNLSRDPSVNSALIACLLSAVSFHFSEIDNRQYFAL